MNRRDLGPDTRVSLTIQQHLAVFATVVVIVATVVTTYTLLTVRLDRIEDRIGALEHAATGAGSVSQVNASHPVLADRGK